MASATSMAAIVGAAIVIGFMTTGQVDMQNGIILPILPMT